MNARQKAKYYKRKYEELAEMKVPTFRIYEAPRTVMTLRSKRECHKQILDMEPRAYMIAMDGLKQGILQEADKFITYKKQFNPDRNFYEYEARLDVVVRENENGMDRC